MKPGQLADPVFFILLFLRLTSTQHFCILAQTKLQHHEKTHFFSDCDADDSHTQHERTKH
jgi:hypothetical protein